MTIIAGVGDNKNIIKASQRVDFTVQLIDSPEEFIESITENRAHAYVRGSIGASQILAGLRSRYGEFYRASFIEINGHKFFLAPVGIDEGDNLEQKLRIIELGAQFLKKINIKPKIAVLSSGRAQDVGRSQKIDKSIAEGELLVEITSDKYPVKHHYILIEEAIQDNSNFILAPDGVTGNLIFRSLVLSGCGKSHGAVTLGMDVTFIDTSRSLTVEGYTRALKFAKYLKDMG
ncbi:MAG TPA: methanogenesis marker protein Mmp4/MtxX [Methanobacterium sp.]|jgi:putative methanogen marker protein 4|nr:MAG: methyltransferase [Methanobacterium sp.]HOI71564.1 methanogenesis marker protein Mmp4/MtxX [Methanobacterium sp.]HPX78657.1 methanogenesis marker protein Mmp4/MtxX [Methanobacterium sp.]